MSQAVRWEVNAIITDTTKTWLDLRSALHSKFNIRCNIIKLVNKGTPDS